MQVFESGVSLENREHRARIVGMAVPYPVDRFHPSMPDKLAGRCCGRPGPYLDHAWLDLPRHQRTRRVLGQDTSMIDDREPIELSNET